MDETLPASVAPFIPQLSEDDLRAVDAAVLPPSQLATGPSQLFREDSVLPVGRVEHMREEHTTAENPEDLVPHFLPRAPQPGPPQLFREESMLPIGRVEHMSLPAASPSPHKLRPPDGETLS